MKIYHTATQEDYDALMIELEEKGYKWNSDAKPRNYNGFKRYGKDTYIYDEYGVISLSSGEYFKKYHSDETLVEYKAKGENMTQEKMKQNILDWSTDVSIAVEAVIKDIKFQMKKSTVEADLKEAKSSAKKLIEKIDEYLEFLKPDFKVGDYVTVDVNDRTIIAKIDELSVNEIEVHGLWYDRTLVNVKQDYWFSSELNKIRHATPEEIAEYEVALTFHKHGRKPFEVKDGDLLENKFGKFIAYKSLFVKENFTVEGNAFIKAVEEVNEWIGADDE